MSDERDLPMLTGAYALGAVDDLEAARVRELLRSSPEAAAEVRSFTETAALLGAAEAVEPPPDMRAAVLAQVHATRQAPPVTQPPVVSRPARGSRWLAVAAAGLLVLTLGTGVAAWQFREDASQVTAANEAMTQVLSDPERMMMDADFAGGHATLVVSGDRVVVLGTDVEPPPEGKGYQLWMLEGDRPIPSVMLTETGDGGYWADTSGYQDGQAMAVTVEPETGSQAPSSDPLFVAGA
jgi:anti-sigma-K factor RskA